jgi:flagellar M-ring protein FliF
VGSFFGGLQRFGIGRLIAVLGAAAGAVAVLIGVMMNVGGQPDALLYSSLDLKEASEITAALSAAGVKHKVQGDGSVIMVPRDQVSSARLLVASKGLPTSGSVGYEIFDNTSVLGQTEFVQNLNKKRALEGELARTIRSLKGVTSAKVLLVIPERQLFEENAAAPTASIVVGLGGRGLAPDQVRSLQNLVAGAVEGLKPERVTVVDENNKLLAAASEEGQGGLTSGLAADRKSEAEERVRRAIKDVVEGVVGPGKAKVTVAAELDMTRVTVQEEKFDPDGQVVRSTTTSAQKSTDGSSVGGAASAGANLPGGSAGGGADTSSNDANEETTNYEISKSTKTEVTEPGAIKRLSVAVAVDGVTTVGKDGKVTYRARTPDEMARIETLVKAAMGFSADRRDEVAVSNLRFDREAEIVGGAEAKAPLFDFDKNDIMRGVELLILAVVGILLVFFVLRPMLKAGAGGGAPAGFATGPALAGASAGAAPQLVYAAGSSPGGVEQPLALAGPSEMDQRIDIARIEGQVKVSSVKKVADFVDKHPEESVSILRSWLHEN